MATRIMSPTDVVYQIYEAKVGRSIAQISEAMRLIDLTTSRAPVKLLSRRARRLAALVEHERPAVRAISRDMAKRNERRSTNRPSRKPKKP